MAHIMAALTHKPFAALSNEELYFILKLRAKVFVVEQGCAYNDLDGIDLNAHHVFCRVGDRVVGALRFFKTPEGTSIGRVVVDPDHRREKLGAKLMTKALELIRSEKFPMPIWLNAQVRYSAFYASLGYIAEPGSENIEDGIDHIRMWVRE